MNSKKLAFFLFCTLAFSICASAARQNETLLRGTAVDVDGVPAGFATAYLSGADGAIVCGTTADADGRFELRAAYGEYKLTVSLVGYKDASQTVRLKDAQMELPAIRLEEDSEMLGEAMVQAVMPKTRITGEGLATSVRGSVLENAGTARDVLGKVPGLIKGRDGLEVIGKGAPQIYINGHKVTDSGELDRLLSHEIQSVEVISNPGAQYDATVRAVVRIRTVKRQGEGFGFNVNMSDAQSLRRKENNDPDGSFNANYRNGGLDVFGGINAAKGSEIQLSDIVQETLGQELFKQDGIIDADFAAKSAGLNGGFNWQLADNHSVGFKADWNSTYHYGEHVLIDENIFLDGAQYDHLKTSSEGSNGSKIPGSLSANAYYNGTAGKLGIDLNLDYFSRSDSKRSRSDEESTIEDATVTTESLSDNRLYAAKLVFSYPVWKGALQFGTEETFSRLSDEYSLKGAAVPASSSRVREDNYAGFVNYGFMLGKIGQVGAGLRYEHVNYSYDDLLGSESFSKRYDNLFPSLSFAGAFGPVQTILSYSARTARPSFSMLSSAIRYNNRYTLQSGNAKLQPQTLQEFSLTSIWKFLTFVANYNRTDNPIITWAFPYNSEGVIMLQPFNLGVPTRGLSAFLSATPTVGVWTMGYTVGMQQSWLSVDAAELDASSSQVLSFNDKPIWIAQLLNTFSLKKGWQLELGGEYHSPGYSQNILVTNHFFDLSAAVQKTMLRDGSLVLRLEGKDLAGLGNNNIFTDRGSYRITQSLIHDTRRVVFSVRYRFNSADSKYKGTGAGKDARDRMR